MTASNSSNINSGGSASSVEQLLILSVGASTTTDAGGSIATMVVLAVLAAVTNSLLLSILLLRRPLRAHPSNRLVMSLTAVNLLLALLVLPMCAVVSYSQAVTAHLLNIPSQGELPHGRNHVSQSEARATASANESFELASTVALTAGTADGGAVETTGGVLTTRETSVAVDVRSETVPVRDINIDGYFAQSTMDLSTPSVMYQTTSRKVNVEDLLPEGDEWYNSVSANDQYVLLRRRRSVKNLPSMVMDFAKVLSNSTMQCDKTGNNHEQENLCDRNKAILEKLANYETLMCTMLKSDYVYDLKWQRKLVLCKEVLLNAKSRINTLDSLSNRQISTHCFRELNSVLGQLIKKRCKTVMQVSSSLEPKLFSLCDHYSKFMSKWTQLLSEISRRNVNYRQDQAHNLPSHDPASLSLEGLRVQLVHDTRTAPIPPSKVRVGRAVREDKVLSQQEKLTPQLASDLLYAKSQAESSALCILVGFLTNWLLTTSSFSVAVIALDRYLSLTHPLAPSSGVVARERCKLLLFSCWMGGLLVAFPPFVSWGRYRYRSDWGSCGVVWRASPSYATVWLLLVVVLPLVLLTSCYVRLLRVARNKCRKVNVGTMLGEGQKTSTPASVAAGDVKKTTSAPALETLRKLSPASVHAKLAERKPSDEGIHSGESSPLSITRKSSVSSQDWQLRRSYSNSSQLSPYSKTYVQGSAGSKDTNTAVSTEGIVRSCSSQILPYTSLLKNSSLSLHYSPKEQITDASSKQRGSFYRPKSLHLEQKLDDTMPKSIGLSKQHHSTSELKKIDSNFLHPNMHNSALPGRSNLTLRNSSQEFESSHVSERPCQICSPTLLEPEVSFKTQDGVARTSTVQKHPPNQPTSQAALDRRTRVPSSQSPSRMYPGDLPPRPLPKAGSDCTLAIPASHRKYYKMTAPSVRRSCSDADAVKKRRGSRCSRTQSLLSWSPSLKVGLSRRASQRNSWGWESSPGKGLLTVSVVVGVQLVTWLPFCSVVALEMLGPHQDLLVPVGVKWYASVLLYCGCVLQPLVYGLLNRTIRKQTRTLLSYHSRRRVHVPAKCLWLTALYTLLLKKLSGNTADPLKLKVGSGSRRSTHDSSNIFSATPPRTSAAAMVVPPKQLNSQSSCTCSTINAFESRMKTHVPEVKDSLGAACSAIDDINGRLDQVDTKSGSVCETQSGIPASSSTAHAVFDPSVQKLSYRDRCHTVSAIMKPRNTYKKMMNEPVEIVDKSLEAVSVIELRETPSQKLGINTGDGKGPCYGVTKPPGIFKVQPVPYRDRGYSMGAKLIISRRQSNISNSEEVDDKPFSSQAAGPIKIFETPIRNISSGEDTLHDKHDSVDFAGDPGFFIKRKKKSLIIPQLVTIPATPPTFLSSSERNSASPSNLLPNLSCSSPSSYSANRLSPTRNNASPLISRNCSRTPSNSDKPTIHTRRKKRYFNKSLTVDIPRGRESLSDVSCDTNSPRSFDFLLRSPLENCVQETARSCERQSFEALNSENDHGPRYIDSSCDSSSMSDESNCFKRSSIFLNQERSTDHLEVHLYSDSELLHSEQESYPVTSMVDCGTETISSLSPNGIEAKRLSAFIDNRRKEVLQASSEVRNNKKNRFTRGATVEGSMGNACSPLQTRRPRSSSVPPE
ncbi:G protein-coupled receptor rhodopsin-like [Trinorchestia longiramus]|nr:G protein-coupled receptor rhodopsin-like [Trinorchestia longiramus]